jgi:hypothetical protein
MQIDPITAGLADNRLTPSSRVFTTITANFFV